MNTEKIDIVIPTAGERIENLILLLETLFNQKLSRQSKDLDFSISEVNIYISINPTSAKFEQKILSKIKNSYNTNIFNLNIIQNKKRGANEARQNGFAAGKNNIVFFFDDDCELHSKNLILNHIKFHQLKTEALAVGGQYKFKGSRSFSLGPHYFHEQNNWYRKGLINFHNRTCAYLLGGHFSIKRQMARRYQLEFDTTMKFGATEKDFFLRALQYNQIMIHSKLTVTHYYEFGIMTYLKKIFKQGQGNYYMATKGLFFKPILKIESSTPAFIHFLFDTAYWLGYYSKQNQFFSLIIKNIHLRKF